MRILLIKPHLDLLVARRLQEGFLHLEPLELEIVAGGIPEENEVKILDLSLEVRYPLRELIKVVFLGIKFVVATRTIYKDYIPERKRSEKK